MSILRKGIAGCALKKYKEALSCFQNEIRLRGDFAEAQENIAAALQTLTRYDEALLAYQRFSIRPATARDYCSVGNILSFKAISTRR